MVHQLQMPQVILLPPMNWYFSYKCHSFAVYAMVLLPLMVRYFICKCRR